MKVGVECWREQSEGVEEGIGSGVRDWRWSKGENECGIGIQEGVKCGRE